MEYIYTIQVPSGLSVRLGPFARSMCITNRQLITFSAYFDRSLVYRCSFFRHSIDAKARTYERILTLINSWTHDLRVEASRKTLLERQILRLTKTPKTLCMSLWLRRCAYVRTEQMLILFDLTVLFFHFINHEACLLSNLEVKVNNSVVKKY